MELIACGIMWAAPRCAARPAIPRGLAPTCQLCLSSSAAHERQGEDRGSRHTSHAGAQRGPPRWALQEASLCPRGW